MWLLLAFSEVLAQKVMFCVHGIGIPYVFVLARHVRVSDANLKVLLLFTTIYLYAKRDLCYSDLSRPVFVNVFSQ